MLPQQFAKQHNLKIKQVRELCLELFGNIPQSLSNENVSALEKALASAAQSLVALPDNSLSDELIATNQDAIENIQNEKIVKIIGVATLRENLQLYLQDLKKHYLEQEFEINSLQFKIEQGFYNNLVSYQQSIQEKSLARIKKNTQSFTKQGIETLKADSNTPNKDIEILGDIGDLMDFFNIA
jgi:hypothetical protein